MLSIIDGVATVYLGDYYEYEVGTGITRSYYDSGSDMRVEQGSAGAGELGSEGVFYLIKDHASTADLRSALSTGLGSTNLMIDSAGNMISEMRYKAWGETRFASGISLTDYAYTGQRQ